MTVINLPNPIDLTDEQLKELITLIREEKEFTPVQKAYIIRGIYAKLLKEMCG